MQTSNMTPGNGLIRYFRIENMEHVRENLRNMKHEVEEEIQLNPNSGIREFSLRDPDDYYLSISEFHKYNQ